MKAINVISVLLDSKLVRALFFGSLLITMFNLSGEQAVSAMYVIAAIAALDALYTIGINTYIHKNGRFYLTFDVLNNVFVMTSLMVIMALFAYKISGDMITQAIFVTAFMFAINKTFDVNENFLKELLPKKDRNYQEDGYSTEASAMLHKINDDLATQENRSAMQKLSGVIDKFLFDVNFQVTTFKNLVLMEKQELRAIDEVSQAFGMAEVARKMTFKEIFVNNYLRVSLDILLALVAWLVIC
jgi:hypothetical protein